MMHPKQVVPEDIVGVLLGTWRAHEVYNYWVNNTVSLTGQVK